MITSVFFSCSDILVDFHRAENRQLKGSLFFFFSRCTQNINNKQFQAMSSSTKALDPAFQGAGQRVYPLK